MAEKAGLMRKRMISEDSALMSIQTSSEGKTQ